MSPKMEGLLGCLLLMVLLCDARRDKTPTVAPPQRQDVCDITDRLQKIHCYCSRTPRNASKAECWVFNGDITPDEPIWDAFQGRGGLQEVNFNVRMNGGMSFVPTRALKYLRKLETLTISFGGIGTLPGYAFANLSSLRELTITKNMINSLKPYAIAKLANLHTLRMDENRISEIGNTSFAELPVLEKLSLTSNNLSDIHNGAFKQLNSLIEMDLNTNSISSLNRETFGGLDNLKKLEIQHNKLRVLNDLTFAELWNLQELFLDENQLTVISERAFDGLAQLKLLSLNFNRLTALTGGLLEGVRGVSSLYIKKNFLQTITADDIKPILDNLKNTTSHLVLDDNQFVCDCRLSWMHQLRADTKNEETRISLEGIECSMDRRQPKKDLLFDSTHATLEVGNELDYDEQRDEVTSDGSKKKLFHIPVDSLPCPEELKESTDAPLLRPSRGEVKDFRGQSSPPVQSPVSGSMKPSMSVFWVLVVLCSVLH